MTELDTIKSAASYKFGIVHSVYLKESTEPKSYKMVIERLEPVFVDRPFMSITAFLNENYDAVFLWGHYDLTKEQAEAIVSENTKQRMIEAAYDVAGEAR